MFMRNAVITLLSLLFISNGAYTKTPLNTKSSNVFCRCQPADSCWPNENEWNSLNTAVQGRLVKLSSPLDSCKLSSTNTSCQQLTSQIKNPFFLETQPALTQYSGWFNAWRSTPSEYAVTAKNAEDVAAAINFASKHNIRLVVKGTGHDYLGRSNGKNSLLIWTHNMRDIKVDETFIPEGCKNKLTGIPAVTVGAGVRWLEVYEEVTGKLGRYVQGGGCTSVGAAGGFMQGGGFGFFAKKFGTGAGNLLEAELVTANGDILTANACQNKDIFWAIRGGGGGTFGVVTKMTMKTHDLPRQLGMVRGAIKAKTDSAFEDLIEHIIVTYRRNLNNENWGIVFSLTRGNSVNVLSFFQGITEREAQAQWQPLLSWMKKYPDKFKVDLKFNAIPPQKFWDYDYLNQHFPDFIIGDPVTDKPRMDFWYRVTSQEVSTYIYSFLSRLIPQTLFDEANTKTFARALFFASRFANSVDLHTYKGLAGSNDAVLKQTEELPLSPLYNQSAIIAIITGFTSDTKGDSKPASIEVQNTIKRLEKAMEFLRKITPQSAGYLNEANYFEPNWQQAFWGKKYEKLLAIKQKYDPSGLFYCHHCVGSEQWTEDGLCRLKGH